MLLCKGFGIKIPNSKETFDEIVSRIHRLQPNSQQLWGKMTVSQMLSHITQALKVVTEDTPPPRMFTGRLFGWLLKKKVYDDSPMQKNLPTVPSFLVCDDKNLEQERQKILKQLKILWAKGQNGVHYIAHPFFGKLTGEQWGIGIWKHIDHHLKQFGV